jgi:hypothetical protein
MTEAELITWEAALREWQRMGEPEDLATALLEVKPADREAILARVPCDGTRAEVRKLLAVVESGCC